MFIPEGSIWVYRKRVGGKFRGLEEGGVDGYHESRMGDETPETGGMI